jgi:hypothetical protein
MPQLLDSFHTVGRFPANVKVRMNFEEHPHKVSHGSTVVNDKYRVLM